MSNRAQYCGCDSAFGYEDDGTVRHEAPGCAFERWENYVDEERRLIEELDGPNEAAAMWASRWSIFGDRR